MPLAIAGLKAAGISQQAGRKIITRLMLSDSGESDYHLGQLGPEAISKVKLITAQFAPRKRGIIRQGGMGELAAGEESRLLRGLRQEEIRQIGESLSEAERDEFDLWNGSTARRVEGHLAGISLNDPPLRALLVANRIFDHEHRLSPLRIGDPVLKSRAPSPSEHLQARQALFELREREFAILGAENFVRYLARADRKFENLTAKVAAHRSLTAPEARQLWRVFALFELRALETGMNRPAELAPATEELAAALREEITNLLGPDAARLLPTEIEQLARGLRHRIQDFPVVTLPSS